MHKRNIGGILKYGERTYKNPTEKLQSGGGFTSYAKGYNWREDPYELMLLQNKFKQDRANTYSDGLSGIGSGGRGKAGSYKAAQMSDMPTLDKGLEGSRFYANQELQGLIINYKANVAKYGLDWIKGYDGQIAYQAVKQKAVSLNANLVSEKQQYDKSLADYKDKNGTNMNTLAISTNGAMFATDKSKPEQGVTSISMTDYLADIDRYKLNTVSDFTKWKSQIAPMNSGSIIEFLDNGAISAESVYESYIKPNEYRIEYAIVKDKLVKKATSGDAEGKELGDIPSISRGIANLLAGKPAYANTEAAAIDDGSSILVAAQSVYGSIMNNTDTGSRLKVSLISEVLQDRRHTEEMKKLGTVQERNEYMHKQIAYTLLQKIVDKGAVKAGKASDGSGKDGSVSYSNKIGNEESSLLDIALGTNSSHYEVGVGLTVGKEKRIGVASFPITEGIKSSDMNLPKNEDSPKDTHDQIFISHNDELGNQAKIDQIYMEDGTPLQDLTGNSSSAKSWIRNDAVLAPDTGAQMIWIPTDKKGKPMMKEYSKISAVGLKAREAYVVALKKLNIPVGADATELLPGNIDEDKVAAFSQYQTYIESWKDAGKLRKASDADKNNPDLKKRANIAEAMSKIVLDSQKEIKEALNGNHIILKSFYMVRVLFDDDDKEFVDEYNKMREGEFGDNTIKEITDDNDREYLQGLAGIDNTNWFAKDHIYETNILMPTSSVHAIKDSGGKSEEARKVALAMDKQRQLIEKMSQQTVGAGNDTYLVAKFLINI